jgi:HAE1 family hydrophobic/amphiphilic exporter-1
MGCVAGALVLTGLMFTHTPTGFTPDEDQGYFIVTMQAPEGVSLDYTERVTRDIERRLRQFPEVLDIFDVNGFGFTGNGPNHATMFIRMKPWAERPGFQHSVTALIYRLYPIFGQIPEAQIFAFNPPSIQGVGNFGGFQYELQDTGNVGLDTLTRTAYTYMGVANQNPNLSQVYTTFRNDSPQLVVDLDRQKAKSLGIPLTSIFSTMQVNLGSLYVNDFDYLNRAYRVYVQADQPFRSRVGDLQNIYVRSSTGGNIVPLTELLTTHIEKSAPVIYHYNLFRSIELSGQPAPGHGSGDAIAAMEKISKQIDPPGVSHEWSGISLDEIESGSLSALIFGLGILVVYLVLAAQYESLADPFIILMAVPLAILGALAAVWIRNLSAALINPGIGFVLSDVYAQVGFVMLIGLASKNAILIVEFANQLRAQGLSAADAARQAAETRLRPILMTSFAFILGIAPLVFAGGAGSASRHSLGTPVFGGMILSTFLNLIVVPVLYVIVVNTFERNRKGPSPVPPAGHAGTEPAEFEPATAI